MEDSARYTNESIDDKLKNRLYAFGFNAHGQLDRRSKADLFVPQILPTTDVGDDADVCFAGWSETICQ